MLGYDFDYFNNNNRYWTKDILNIYCQLFPLQGNMEYYASELELNAKFHTFATNSSVLFRGHNTVQAQVKYKNKRGESTKKHTSHVPFMFQHQYWF